MNLMAVDRVPQAKSDGKPIKIAAGPLGFSATHVLGPAEKFAALGAHVQRLAVKDSELKSLPKSIY